MGVLILGWLIPGAGHWWLQERWKGVIIFILLMGTFIGGLLMGSTILPLRRDAVSMLSFLGRIGNGLPFLIGLCTRFRIGSCHSSFYEIGSVYTTISGVLNFLILLNLRSKEKRK